MKCNGFKLTNIRTVSENVLIINSEVIGIGYRIIQYKDSYYSMQCYKCSLSYGKCRLHGRVATACDYAHSSYIVLVTPSLFSTLFIILRYDNKDN